jgi:hypothetical protein
VQVCTGTLTALLAPQVMVTQLLLASPVCGTQPLTGPPVEVVVQVMVCQPLPALPVCGVHDATAVGPLTTVGVGQVIVTQPLPALPVCGVQTPALPLLVMVEQVIPVHWLPEAAVCGVHEATASFKS